MDRALPWNVPTCDDQFGHQYATGRIYENGATFQSQSRFPSDTVEEIVQETTVNINADATDEKKIVRTKFVLGFCHGQ